MGILLQKKWKVREQRQSWHMPDDKNRVKEEKLACREQLLARMLAGFALHRPFLRVFLGLWQRHKCVAGCSQDSTGDGHY